MNFGKIIIHKMILYLQYTLQTITDTQHNPFHITTTTEMLQIKPRTLSANVTQ